MMDERFTERVRKLLYIARQEAASNGNDNVSAEHILLAMIKEGNGVAVMVLTNLGVNLEKISQTLQKIIKEGEVGGLASGEIPLGQEARHVVSIAIEEAKKMEHKHVGTEHLLLGLLRKRDCTPARILSEYGVSYDIAKSEIMKLLGGFPPTLYDSKDNKKSKTPALDYFCRNLTELAMDNKLDPIIGREKEIERVIQVLSRRKKNNPVLIGEPGVGKTAIAEGLAQKIIKRDVPEVLWNKEVLSLDLASVVAGTKYRGQFEERLKAILNEIRNTDNIVLFIDELHTIVGAGAAEGAIDASNMLKPALARGELQCIGATTLEEYRKYIEKEGALERRFQPIMVSPPSVEDTIEILEGLKHRYEEHHGIKYTDEAIVAAARLSERYITDRFLPDKAIDVIDEAGARVKLANFPSAPDINKLEKKMDELEQQKRDAVKEQDYEKAALLRDKQDKLEEEIRKVRTKWEKEVSSQRIMVTAEDIREVISMWTGIPLFKLEEKEQIKLLRMEEELRKRVVGQDEALEAVSKAIRRGRTGLKDPRRPIGSFIFLGPTGVGKTELAKALAEFLFDSEDALVRADMSEYMEKFAVSRLVGAPPGYVGYNEGGQLTEKVRRRPYSVVLLDEIEKAHPDVFNILLQILEDGHLTDSFGRKVNFKNTVLIMTSNIGSKVIKHGGSLGFRKTDEGMDYENMKARLMDEVNRRFNPEFLNRVDEIVVFHTLSKKEMMAIVDIMFDKVKMRVKERGLNLVLADKAKELLLEEGFDPTFGARPLRRAIQRLLEDPLAEEILNEKHKSGDTILVNRKNNKLTFEKLTRSIATEKV
ncbi:MAG: ATP-dependent Clp protease ATP-binding subunit ClpC [Candidatus Cloacimonas sp. 4484_209]|nr:MAG: ATP-dependent Clp protease ATP-binding subunit ClpC [Candidatus Cloacimonas sp. 4484_209]